MTMDCADRSGLQNWFDRRRIPLSPGTCLASSEAFVQRGLVAEYATDNLAPRLASGRVRDLRATALAARPAAGRFLIACDDGSELAADAVVIATSHPPPGIPAAFAGLADSPRLIADSSAADRLAEVARQARNLLVWAPG